MSQGNAAAAIGLVNTTKIPAIGLYVQDTVNPNSDGPYNGCVGNTYWNRDAIDEGAAAVLTNGFTVPANSGAATGKVGRYVTTSASPMTVAADGLCSVSAAGVVTATATTGLYKTYIAPATVIPAGSWMWVFLV